MIKRLYVDNYKCLVNFELELHALSLLLGPNESTRSRTVSVRSSRSTRSCSSRPTRATRYLSGGRSLKLSELVARGREP